MRDTQAPTRAPRRQRGLGSHWGSRGFFRGPTQEGEAMSELETKHYLSNGTAVAVDPREALDWAGDAQVRMVDLKFCDLLGTWQHVTLPLSAFDESAFEEGLGF